MVVKPYRFMIYRKSGKAVVHIGDKVYPVDELQVDVPTWAEFDIEGVTQFVMAGEGIVKMHDTRRGDEVYKRCVIKGE